MGLIFAIQADLRKTTPKKLVLKSSKKKFGLGGSMLFGAALLATMYTAAFPLFDLMWKEGNYFDKAIAIAVCLPIILYPILALGCFMYQEIIFIEKMDGYFRLEAFEKLGPLVWNKRNEEKLSLNDFKIENWKGALNQAALDAIKRGIPDKYATRGHWMLKLRKDNNDRELILERRARKDEIEDLFEQVKSFSEANA
jgi:hypothetical protein